jgi:hypothetical protein
MNGPRLAPMLAATALAFCPGFAAPALAQDYPFQGFAAMDAMNTLHANVRDRMLDASDDDATSRPGRSAGRPPSTTSSARVPDMGFHRDPAVTRQVQAELVQTVLRSEPEAGRDLAQTLANRDPITTVSPVFRRYGLDTANVVDAVAIYHLAMWGVANNQEAAMTPEQARGARAHVARVVDFDGMGLTTPAARQRFAETIIYQGLLMDAAIDQAQTSGDEAMQRILSDAAQRRMLDLGMDMRRVVITGDGFVPR